MTKGDCPAVHVALLRIEVEIAHELPCNDGEGLVDLEEIDVVEGHACALHDLASGWAGLVEHELR